MVSSLYRVVLPKELTAAVVHCPVQFSSTSSLLSPVLTAREEERIKSASHPAVQIALCLIEVLLGSAGIQPINKHRHADRTAKQHERIEAVL
jgi:hypothetical protein